MKRSTVVIADGREREFQDLSPSEKSEFINEINRRALKSLGYEEKKNSL